jgi:GAF domain-containing protein
VHQELTSARPKVTLSREAFQQLLEAAYVIQQQNDRAQVKLQKGDSSGILAQISDTQRLIQTGKLDVQQASELIVTQLHKITASTWTAVGMVEADKLHYIAVYGEGALSSEPIALDHCLSAECLRTGRMQRSPDLTTDRIPSYALNTTAIESLVAVPVYSEGVLAGVLEAGFPEANGFDDQDVSTCQLMAGLVTESIARAAEVEWKRSLATERATMLETLERIKPQLERLVKPAASTEASEIPSLSPEEPAQTTEENLVPVVCRECGNVIAEEESYCGLCGVPSPIQKPTGDIQSKWASLWHMQQAAQTASKNEEKTVDDADDSEISNSELLALKRSADRDLDAELPNQADDTHALAIELVPEEKSSELAVTSPWTSATRAKQWLKSLEPGAGKKVWLSAVWRQRANIYLGAAVVLLISVIAGWGSSAKSANASAPQLSLVDKTLIALNLAEAPPAPVHMGNPDTQVWVDVHTALYYCPGSELYGKTTGGKMASQRDAQQDQFQPALRKSCD